MPNNNKKKNAKAKEAEVRVRTGSRANPKAFTQPLPQASPAPGVLNDRAADLLRAGGAANEREAVRLLQEAAEHGHASAQYNWGVCFYNGTGVSQDPEQAVACCRLAAAQGLADAQYFWVCVCWMDGVRRKTRPRLSGCCAKRPQTALRWPRPNWRKSTRMARPKTWLWAALCVSRRSSK
jgi:hypothetical protein